MSNLIPVPMTHHELASMLEEMAALVRMHDSWEGNIQYLVPNPDEFPGVDADVIVSGTYRVGNLDGQGGIRMIGRVPE